MTSVTSFSSDGVEVISRQVEVTPGRARRSREGAELRDYYETERCLGFIQDHNFQRVSGGS